MAAPELQAPGDFSRGKGRIELILGPMFSGKTTELIRRITRYRFANFKCLVIKYSGDIRYSKSDVATHDARSLSAISCSILQISNRLQSIIIDIRRNPCVSRGPEKGRLTRRFGFRRWSHLQELAHKTKAFEFDVVGIDEGQFFPDTVEFCEEMANHGKVVVVAALDGTFQRTGFGDLLSLVPLAESVVKLHAVCMQCFNSASFTKRMTEEKAVELIGGADKYMSVCRECYHGMTSGRSCKRSPLKAILENSPSKKQAV